MTRNKLLKRLAYLILFIFFANTLAQRFYLYTSIWYYDMFMHFLGGLFLGLGFVWLFWPHTITPNHKLFLKIMFSVLAIGAAWEIYELIFSNMIGGAPFDTLDTLSDICFDLAGGFTGALYLRKIIMPAHVSEI